MIKFWLLIGAVPFLNKLPTSMAIMELVKRAAQAKRHITMEEEMMMRFAVDNSEFLDPFSYFFGPEGLKSLYFQRIEEISADIYNDANLFCYI